LVELVNLDEGTPSGRIAETVTALRGACRGVAAFTDPTARAMAMLKNNQLMAVIVSAQQLAPPGASLEPAITRFAENARGIAPVTALYGDLLTSEFDAARAAGITYWINPLERIRVAEAA
jgi:FMN phosphatase YigB (HAD superfamily)